MIPPVRAPLLMLERKPGERVTVRWVPYVRDMEAIEIAVERRRGDEWARAIWFTIPPGEIFLVSDAFLAACNALLEVA